MKTRKDKVSPMQCQCGYRTYTYVDIDCPSCGYRLTERNILQHSRTVNILRQIEVIATRILEDTGSVKASYIMQIADKEAKRLEK